MNVSATIIAFYLPVFIMIVLYFQVSVAKQTESSQNARSCKWLIPRKRTVLVCTGVFKVFAIHSMIYIQFMTATVQFNTRLSTSIGWNSSVWPNDRPLWVWVIFLVGCSNCLGSEWTSNLGLPWNNQKKKSFEFRWRRTSKDGENASRKDTKWWRSVSLISINPNLAKSAFDGRWSKWTSAYKLTLYFLTIVQ